MGKVLGHLSSSRDQMHKLLQESRSLRDTGSGGHSSYLQKLRQGHEAMKRISASLDERRVVAAAQQAEEVLAKGHVQLEVDEDHVQKGGAAVPLWQQGDATLNTKDAIQARFQLRSNPLVLEALHTFWEAVRYSVQSGGNVDQQREPTLNFDG